MLDSENTTAVKYAKHLEEILKKAIPSLKGKALKWKRPAWQPVQPINREPENLCQR